MAERGGGSGKDDFDFGMPSSSATLPAPETEVDADTTLSLSTTKNQPSRRNQIISKQPSSSIRLFGQDVQVRPVFQAKQLQKALAQPTMINSASSLVIQPWKIQREVLQDVPQVQTTRPVVQEVRQHPAQQQLAVVMRTHKKLMRYEGSEKRRPQRLVRGNRKRVRMGVQPVQAEIIQEKEQPPFTNYAKYSTIQQTERPSRLVNHAPPFRDFFSQQKEEPATLTELAPSFSDILSQLHNTEESPTLTQLFPSSPSLFELHSGSTESSMTGRTGKRQKIEEPHHSPSFAGFHSQPQQTGGDSEANSRTTTGTSQTVTTGEHSNAQEGQKNDGTDQKETEAEKLKNAAD